MSDTEAKPTYVRNLSVFIIHLVPSLQLKPYGVTVSALLAKAVAVVLEVYTYVYYDHPHTHLMRMCCCLIFQEFPIINAAYKPGQIIYKKDINVRFCYFINSHGLCGWRMTFLYDSMNVPLVGGHGSVC